MSNPDAVTADAANRFAYERRNAYGDEHTHRLAVTDAYLAGAADMQERMRTAADANADEYAERHAYGPHLDCDSRCLADAYRAGARALDDAESA